MSEDPLSYQGSEYRPVTLPGEHELPPKNRGTSTPAEKTDTKLQDVRLQIDATTNVMRDNIEKVIARGDDIEKLREKSEVLQENSTSFWEQSRALRRKMCCKNAKTTAIIAGIILLILIILIVIIVKSTQ